MGLSGCGLEFERPVGYSEELLSCPWSLVSPSWENHCYYCSAHWPSVYFVTENQQSSRTFLGASIHQWLKNNDNNKQPNKQKSIALQFIISVVPLCLAAEYWGDKDPSYFVEGPPASGVWHIDGFVSWPSRPLKQPAQWPANGRPLLIFSHAGVRMFGICGKPCFGSHPPVRQRFPPWQRC